MAHYEEPRYALSYEDVDALIDAAYDLGQAQCQLDQCNSQSSDLVDILDVARARELVSEAEAELDAVRYHLPNLKDAPV